MFLRIMFCTCCAGALIRGQDTEAPSVRLRVQSFARERALITNPIAWVQLEDRVAEGTRVQEGQPVFTLDLEGIHQEIRNLENRLEQAANRAEKDKADMESTLQNLRDRREVLLDNRSIQIARKEYLESWPRGEDVAIAEGRLAVARERMQAEEKNLSTMRERLDRNLIAPLQVKQAEWSHALQNARTVYAETMLEIIRRPARPEQIRMVELRIRNLNLEIEKLDAEIPTQEIILGIQQETRARRVENIREELGEKKEQLAYRELTAPKEGVLLYSSQMKRQLTEGSKPSKGMVIGEIPDPASLAFEGVIPEQTRHLFEEGDPAELELNMYPGRVFPAVLTSISPFSRDAVEDADNPSGVKLVDVELEIRGPMPELPIGIYGWATLKSGKPLDGQRVPVSWVRYEGGKPHLSVNGTYEPVDGILHQDSLFLTPPHPALSSIQETGVWPDEESELDLESGNRFTTAAELLPLESVAVQTPRARAWDMKISWLFPENTRVEEGEVVARLDSEMLEDRVNERTEQAETRRGEREATEQQLEIRRSQGRFQLTSATNTLEIARLNEILVHTENVDAEVAKADLDLITARIQLEMAEAEKARGDRTPELTAPAEQARRERQVRRRRLQLEKAEIQMEQAREGATEREKSLATIDVFRERAKLADLEAEYQRDLSRLQSRYQWQLRREQRNEERLDRSQEQLAALEITAPVSGLVKYEKLWDGVRHSKTRPGMRVWPRQHLLNLSNTSEVYVEVPLPERYVRELNIGMPVQVVIPSEGNLQWRGRVTAFGEILEPARPNVRPASMYGNQEVTNEQVLPVRVVVESNPDRALKPGAIAQLIFPFDK